VPIGKLAFMPGKLVHTNEILAMLGDNWFAERSTKQAVDIVDRRLEMVRKTINDLETQLENQKTKIGLTSDVLRFANIEKEINEEGLPIIEIQETEENEVQSRIKKDEKDDLKPSLKQIDQSQAKSDDTSFWDKLLAEEEDELRVSDSLCSSDSDDSPCHDEDDEDATESSEKSESESNDEDDEEEWEETGASTHVPTKAKQIEQTNTPVKSTVIENVASLEEYDAEVLEDEIWKKQIASEYHQKRVNFIAQQGGLSSDESQLPQSSERPKKVSKFKAARLQ
ncbi:432_t:CDS:2, partial [Cetraspora pellucida]